MFNAAYDLDTDPFLEIDWGLFVLYADLVAMTLAIISFTSESNYFLKVDRVSFPTFSSRDLFSVGLITVVITGGD